MNPTWPTQPFYIQSLQGQRNNRIAGILQPDIIPISEACVAANLAPAAFNLWVALPVGTIDGVSYACLVVLGLQNERTPGYYALACQLNYDGTVQQPTVSLGGLIQPTRVSGSLWHRGASRVLCLSSPLLTGRPT